MENCCQNLKNCQKKAISIPLSSINKEKYSSPEYLKTLFTSIIGNNITFNSPFGKKSIIYSDFTASGRGINQIEKFISNEILPFYANVHSNCGFLSEQSENFRQEAKSIVRRYCNTDENNSIIFTGQGTTSSIHKLIKLLNLKEYCLFYNDLKRLFHIRNLFNGDYESFEKYNFNYINDVKSNFGILFKINNFCFSNRWGGFDCVLCRMGFTTESQYNEHEKGEIHLNNLDNIRDKNNKNNFIDSISFKYDNKSNNFINEILNDYELFEPLIFLSIYEHNSNNLSWRETGSKIIYISNPEELKTEIEKYKNHYIKMGSFTSASNITGKYNDIDKLSIIMHKNNGLIFLDYATSAPYIKIDMNKKLDNNYRKLLGFNYEISEEDSNLCFKDSIFFSPHKLLGGPNTPGVLLIQQRIVRNLLVPSEPGGGVVLFVTKDTQNYVKNIEMREESGTPDIIGSLRIGLSLILRERIDDEYILMLDKEINHKIYEKLGNVENLHFLSDFDVFQPHIPIYSFLISFRGKFFHPNFISALLNDIFGIQSRPGCSCASIYGQKLLGICDEDLKKLEILTCTGKEIFRPGYTRMNFPYFYPDYLVDYLIYSIEYIAKNAYKFLSLYAFKIESGKFYHRNEDEKKKWLNDIKFENNNIIIPDFIDEDNKIFISEEQINKMKKEAEELCDDKNIRILTKNAIGKAKMTLSTLFEENEKERWFLIWDDVEDLIPISKEELNNIDSITKKITDSYKTKSKIKWNLIENLKKDILTNKNPSEKNTQNSELNLNKQKIEELTEINPINPNSNSQYSPLTKKPSITLFPEIPKKILKLVGEACKDFNMIQKDDRILVCVSGGKDSLTLLHVLLYLKRKIPFKIEIGACTVDPMSDDFNPKPLINYMKNLNVPYFYEKDKILEKAKLNLQKNSICSYCARMKRGIIYNCARREKYNVIALGQHLDDLAESFLMSVFHNGLLRTMKANYIIDKGDLRVIRPLVYCREKLFKDFSIESNLPVIQENCPACFQSPKERQRMKVLLSQQENLFPSLFSSLLKSMVPLMKGDLRNDGEKKDDLMI